MKDRIDKLMEIAGEDDRKELVLRRDAVSKLREAFAGQWSEENDRKLTAAQEGFEKCMTRMWERYFPKDERFQDRKTALEYLQGNGFKIKHAKFYGDFKTGKGGSPPKLFLQKDGAVLKRDLDAYAITLPRSEDRVAQVDESHLRKMKAEADIAEKKNRLMDIDIGVIEGKYRLVADSDMEKAAHHQMVEVNVRNMHLTEALPWIELVNGDPKRAPELIDAMDMAMDKMFNQLVRTPQFRITFESEEAEAI